MERYKFPPMFGPAHRYPVGTFQRAECFGNELDYTVERVADDVVALAALLKRILVEDPPPWAIWPDPPCRSLDSFLVLSCGRGEPEKTQVLHSFGHHDLCDDCRQFAAEDG